MLGAALASDPLLMPGGGKHLLEMPRQVGWQGLPGSGVCRGVCHGVPGGQSGKRGLCQEPRGSLSLQQKTQSNREQLAWRVGDGRGWSRQRGEGSSDFIKAEEERGLGWCMGWLKWGDAGVSFVSWGTGEGWLHLWGVGQC